MFPVVLLVGMVELDARQAHSRARMPLARTRRAAHSVVALSITWGCGLLVLWLSVGQTDLDDAQLLLDPAAIAGLPWYTGLISNIGILAWTLATAAAAAAAHTARLGGRFGAARFLRQATVLAGLLALDDLFLLHSSAFPKLIGIPKTVTLACYGLFGLAWVAGNLREIARTRWGLLIAAGVAMGASVVVDQTATGQSWALIVEDGSKFLGVLAWAAYFTLTARDIGSSVVRELVSSIPNADIVAGAESTHEESLVGR